MPWRVKSFFSDAQLEDYLNSLAIEPDQLHEVHTIVQGPRTGVRLVCLLDDSQVAAEHDWTARTAPRRTPTSG